MGLSKIFYSMIMFFVMFNISNAATVYKWIDEDGQVHYGSRSESESAKEVKIKNSYIDSGNSTAPLSAEERINKQKRFLNALDKENQSIKDAKKQKEEIKAEKISRCNASQDQLKRYEASGALYDLDEKGDRILLNKKQYEVAMEQAKARVIKWCN